MSTVLNTDLCTTTLIRGVNKGGGVGGQLPPQWAIAAPVLGSFSRPFYLINKIINWVSVPGSLFVLFTITGFGVTLLGLILFWWLHFNDLMRRLITFTSRKAAKCWKRDRTTVAVSRRLFWLLINWVLVFTNFWVKVIVVIQQVSWRPVAATGHNVSFCVIFYPVLLCTRGL